MTRSKPTMDRHPGCTPSPPTVDRVEDNCPKRSRAEVTGSLPVTFGKGLETTNAKPPPLELAATTAGLACAELTTRAVLHLFASPTLHRTLSQGTSRGQPNATDQPLEQTGVHGNIARARFAARGTAPLQSTRDDEIVPAAGAPKASSRALGYRMPSLAPSVRYPNVRSAIARCTRWGKRRARAQPSSAQVQA